MLTVLCVLTQRSKHVSSLRETEIGAVVSDLQRPCEPQREASLERLVAVQALKELTHMSGTSPLRQADKRRILSSQVRPMNDLQNQMYDLFQAS